VVEEVVDSRISRNGGTNDKVRSGQMEIDPTFLSELAQDMWDNGVEDKLFIAETIEDIQEHNERRMSSVQILFGKPILTRNMKRQRLYMKAWRRDNYGIIKRRT